MFMLKFASRVARHIYLGKAVAFIGLQKINFWSMFGQYVCDAPGALLCCRIAFSKALLVEEQGLLVKLDGFLKTSLNPDDVCESRYSR